MSRQYWVSPIPPLNVVNGIAHHTSVALTDITPLPLPKIPANFLDIGVTLRLRAAGQFSTTGTPTLLLGFGYGGTAVALAASAAITTGSGAAAWPWILEYQGRVRVNGAAGSIFGMGYLHLSTSLSAMTPSAIPVTAAARTVAIDTTIEKTLTVFAQWGTSSASNTITCNEFTPEVLS
jgi:hypothetical protein